MHLFGKQMNGRRILRLGSSDEVLGRITILVRSCFLQIAHLHACVKTIRQLCCGGHCQLVVSEPSHTSGGGGGGAGCSCVAAVYMLPPTIAATPMPTLPVGHVYGKHQQWHRNNHARRVYQSIVWEAPANCGAYRPRA